MAGSDLILLVGASITKLLAPALIGVVPLGLLIPGGWHSVPFVFSLALLALTGLTTAVFIGSMMRLRALRRHPNFA